MQLEMPLFQAVGGANRLATASLVPTVDVPGLHHLLAHTLLLVPHVERWGLITNDRRGYAGRRR